MTELRPGLAALGSLVSEDLRARPAVAHAAAVAAADAHPSARAWHLVDLAYSALLGGEPKRAQRVLAELASRAGGPALARHVKAMRLWTAHRDQNWYPGNRGGEFAVVGDDLELAPGPGQDETALLEHVVTRGPAALLTPRAVIGGALGMGNALLATQMADVAVDTLHDLVVHGSEIGDPFLVLWAVLAQADLLWRTGRRGQAAELLSDVRASASDLDQAATLGLTHLVEGDWWSTPGSSPEALGFDLAPVQTPSPRATPAELDRAERCYHAAEQVISGIATDAPGLWAALYLRWGAVAWLRNDAGSFRAHGEIATRAATDSGDVATYRLLSIHMLLADLAEGRFGERLAEIGSGWGPPAAGPVAQTRRWAETDGSTSWCVGLGRLMERAGDAWRRQGEDDRAGLAYIAALHLVAVDPRIPSRTLSTEVAKLDVQRNFSARALVRLERLLTAAPSLTDAADQMLDVAQEIEVLTLMVSAQQPRRRTAAAEHAARGLERIRARLEAVLDLAGRSGIPVAPGQTFTESRAELERLAGTVQDEDLRERLDSLGDMSVFSGMRSLLMRQAQNELDFVNVLIPMSRGDHAKRIGRDADATRWYDLALKAAQGGSPLWTAMVLIAADRLEDARRCVASIAARSLVDDDLLALLALRCGDAETAAAALARSDADPTAGPWRVTLSGAEIALALGDPEAALTLAVQGMDLHEEAISRILRDTDRVSACDDPDVSGLYLVGVKAALALADERPKERVGLLSRAFELMERGRSMAIGHLLGDDPPDAATGRVRAWREAAAEWAADVDRLLAAIDSSPPRDTTDLLAAVDAGEGRLRDVEAALEREAPGALTRRVAPCPPLDLTTVQRRLPPGAAVLQYLTLGDDLVVAAAARDDVVLRRIPVSGRRLNAVIRAYHGRCAEGWGGGVEASELASLLLEPVAGLVRDSARIVVLPFGPLNLLPMQALPFDGAPLGLARVVSYAPSVAVGVPMDFDEPVFIEGAAVVGDPAFDPDLYPQLPRLPGATTEARLVAAALGTSDVLVDLDASEDDVRKIVGGQNVVHLATHGRLDELAPYASSLVLAGRDELTVAELVGMRVGADLVVLSACDTGRGAATLGGDVVGLTRAFLAAGVRRLVVSLWPVDDKTACVTMDWFYEHLVAGVPPAAALARAQSSVHALDGEALVERYAVCSERAATLRQADQDNRRRGAVPLPAELRDDEETPPVLSGSAERSWAPFIMVGG